MLRFTKPVLVSVALCGWLATPAYAELDVAKLKSTIEASLESEYPRLDALYKDITRTSTPIPRSPSRR
jgi:hypothetical protein